MRSEQALTRLQEHQSRAAEILGRAQAALAGSQDVESARLAQMRWELMRVLRDYQLFKHTEIFNPVIQTGTPAEAKTAAQLKDRCVGIAALYADHARKWTLMGAVDAWPHYRTEALRMIRDLEAHMAAELRDTGALLSGIARTRRRG